MLKDDKTKMGENNIPTTDSTSNRVEMDYDMPDMPAVRQIKRSGMIGKLPKSKTTQATKFVRKEKSNLLTDNPFVPKKKFKMPKLPKIKLSGSGKRTAMRGKIK